MAIPAWVGPWVGTPFGECGRDPATGVDCWGLVRAIYAARYGVAVHSLDGEYLSTADHGAIAAAVEAEQAAWAPVAPAAVRVGDAALFRVGAHPRHVGVVVDVGPRCASSTLRRALPP